MPKETKNKKDLEILDKQSKDLCQLYFQNALEILKSSGIDDPSDELIIFALELYVNTIHSLIKSHTDNSIKFEE